MVVDLSGPGATGGTTAYSTGTVVLSQDITAVNDAPLNTVPNAQTINEDGTLTFSSGNGNMISVSDVDAGGGTITTTLDIASGALFPLPTGPGGPSVTGAGTNHVVISGTVAQVNGVLNTLIYQPAANANGPFVLTVLTTDNGNTGSGGTLQDNDTINITVNSVNDAPSGADKTLTGSEDDPLVFTAADFGFTDPVEGNAFLAVIIDTFPANGTLFLDLDGPGGNPPVDLSTLPPGVSVNVSDINLGRLYFQPDTDEFGTGYAQFTFRVQDDGGMLNGGVDKDPVANTIFINITPDNLAPVVDLDGVAPGVNYTTTFVEDGAAVAIGSGVIVSDPDVGLGDLIESATITLTDRVAGDSLTLTGALPPGITAVTTPSVGAITITITGPGTGAQYQALIESIQYATTNQDPTVGGTDLARTITVTVNDGAVNSAVATTTVNISPSDDAPVAQPDLFTITESQTIVAGNLFADNGSGADSDPDGPPLTISAVGGGPGANVGTQFTLDSGALLTVHANGTFDYNPNGIFVRTPTPGSGASNTPSHDSFTYTLTGGNTVTVSITLTGLDTDDLLLGTAGADIMMAGNGTDELIGGLGEDQLYGEGGNDSLTGGAENDLIDGGAGIDTAYFGGSLSYVDTLTGWAITSTTDGTDFVRNTEIVIDGGGHRNLLVRGSGYATLQAALTGAATGDNVRLATGNYSGTGTYGVGGLTVIAQPGAVQNVTYATASLFGITVLAASGADTITGSANNDTLNGGGGADVLNGGAGADYLDGGGAGAAHLNGGSGNDTIVVDADDLVGEAIAGGFDNVVAKVSYALNAGAEVEVLSTTNHGGTAAINLGGNEFGQVLVGNAGNNYLDGGGGVDLLQGLGGNDTYIVDADDRVDEGASGGYDNVAAKTSYVLEFGQEIEVLSTSDHGGIASINLTGNDLNQVVIGNAGANILNGGFGNDLLQGLGGADMFAFTTTLGAGNVDTIADFLSGTDKIGLDDSTFAGLTFGALPDGAFVTGTAALDADDRIIYDSATGALYFDADGVGGVAMVQFATLSGLPALVAGDFTVI
jgi:Ca2+-binding RTX toxin-like protein